MMFADTNGIIVNTTMIVAVAGSLTGTIVVLFKLLMTSRDREAAAILREKDATIHALEGREKSNKEIATEAVAAAMSIANHYREKEGKSPLVPVAPVLPETHSPATMEEEHAAEIATLRAKLALVTVAAGLPPKQTEIENIKLRPAEVVKIEGVERGET
jgi:hypothetical protein